MEECSIIHIHLILVYLVLINSSLKWGGHFHWSWQTFSVKYQIANILGFVSYVVFVTSFQVCRCSIKAVTDNIYANKGVWLCLPYYKNRPQARFGPEFACPYRTTRKYRGMLHFFFFSIFIFSPHFNKCKVQKNAQIQNCGSIAIQVISRFWNRTVAIIWFAEKVH